MKDSVKKKKKQKPSNKKSSASSFKQTLRSYLKKFPMSLSLQDKKNSKPFITGWYVLPMVSLFIILLVLTVYNAAVKQQIASTDIALPMQVDIESYPLVKQEYSPEISAESAMVLDNTSKVILYEKKPGLRFSMASTTKIMTALVALEYFRHTDPITVQRLHEEGAIVGFLPGEKVSFEYMLHALLLPSANDAAYALADNYPGGVTAFVNRMNEKAGELGLHFTHYADPAGLDDDGNYTTVKDLAKLASFAIENEDFAGIIATKRKKITTTDGSKEYELFNLNKLLGENGVIGMKTGYTQGAGEVLVTVKREQGHMFIIIVMKSNDRFKDTETLIRYVSDNVLFINPREYLLNKAP